jgi:hypothetical protein
VSIRRFWRGRGDARIESIGSTLEELSRTVASWRTEIASELGRTRQEVERVGRGVYLLSQSQRGLSDEIGALPAAWRRFVDEAETRAVGDDPRPQVLAGLMPLKDAFLAARNQELWQDAAWRSTFTALEARLDQTLADLGATPVAQPGMRFDGRAHHSALGSHHETPAGTLLAVLRQGYLLDGRVVRLAEVHVSLGPAAADAAPPPDADGAVSIVAAAPEPGRAASEEDGRGGQVDRDDVHGYQQEESSSCPS